MTTVWLLGAVVLGIAAAVVCVALLRTVGHIFTRNKLAENADDIT